MTKKQLKQLIKEVISEMSTGITDDWFKFTEINNFEFESINYGKGKVLVVKDFLKYPDQFYDLVTSFPFFDNMVSGAAVGKGFSIPELHLQSHGKFLLDEIGRAHV